MTWIVELQYDLKKIHMNTPIYVTLDLTLISTANLEPEDRLSHSDTQNWTNGSLSNFTQLFIHVIGVRWIQKPLTINTTKDSKNCCYAGNTHEFTSGISIRAEKMCGAHSL